MKHLQQLLLVSFCVAFVTGSMAQPSFEYTSPAQRISYGNEQDVEGIERPDNPDPFGRDPSRGDGQPFDIPLNGMDLMLITAGLAGALYLVRKQQLAAGSDVR